MNLSEYITESPAAMGIFASIISGLATILGAIPVFFIKNFTKKTESILLGFSSGAMLSAAFFSLLTPGFQHALKLIESKNTAVFVVILGLVVGTAFMWALDIYFSGRIPDVFDKDLASTDRESSSSLWIFILAIMIHNFPEGMAVGLGFATGDTSLGLPITVGICLQNIPEGLIVAIASILLGHSRKKAFWLTALSAAIEPVGGVVGVLLVNISDILLPLGLSFAAGAMLFATIHKVMNEIPRYGHTNHSTISCMLGLIVMTVLDVILG